MNTRPSSDVAVKLLLASGSPYRRELLQRLRLPFEIVVPGIDETRLLDESLEALPLRLATQKAATVAARYPGAIVIGSDQVAELDGELLGKPGSVARCVAQLLRSSGRTVRFLTAVQLIDAPGGRRESHLDVTTVRFRELEEAEIRRYVAADTPLDCAGGFKAESLGIGLFEELRTEDPTALTGLPLLWLSGALRRAGLPVP